MDDIIKLIKDALNVSEIKLHDTWDGCKYTIVEADLEDGALCFSVNVCGCEVDDLEEDDEEGFVLLDDEIDNDL